MERFLIRITDTKLGNVEEYSVEEFVFAHVNELDRVAWSNHMKYGNLAVFSCCMVDAVAKNMKGQNFYSCPREDL